MNKLREHWSSHLGFFLAAAGSAIGLGTLWKFPYVTGENGGGLFVLMYLLCTLFIGIPVFIAELMLGRKAQRGAVGIFDSLSGHSSFWRGVGWLGVISSFLIMSYYSVVGGWGLNYILLSLSQSLHGLSAEEVTHRFELLASSGDITLFWHILFTTIVVLLVLPGVKKGIEYWSKIMTSGLFVLLLLLFFFSMSLEGFQKAVSFVLYPDFSKFKLSSALQALGLSFFTLSLGQGIMLTYGSYMKKNEDIPKTCFLIGISILCIAIIASLMIFPIIFTFGGSPQSGRGLVFKVLPLLFSQLPGSVFISTMFFTLFVFAALTSAIAFVEVIAANLMDLFHWSRKKAVISVGVACCVFGIPSALSDTHSLFANWPSIFGRSFFSTMDDVLVSTWILPLAGLFTSIYAGWFFDPEISKEEFSEGSSMKNGWALWRFSVRWIAPIAILLIFLQETRLIEVDKLLITAMVAIQGATGAF